MGEVRCPACQKTFDPAETVAMPFCSLRCKMVDLGRWLSEEHGMPIEPEDRELQRPESTYKDEQHE